jgi:hypothetical protein
MPKIKVKAKIDAGVHLKYGPIIKGQEYEIEDRDFGPELFERPEPGWLSPLETPPEDVGAVREPPSEDNPPQSPLNLRGEAKKESPPLDKGGLGGVTKEGGES